MEGKERQVAKFYCASFPAQEKHQAKSQNEVSESRRGREGLSSYNNPSAMMSSSSSPSTTTTVIKSCLDILRRLDPAETEKVR